MRWYGTAAADRYKMFEWLMFRCVGLAVLPLRSDLPPELAAAAAGTWVL